MRLTDSHVFTARSRWKGPLSVLVTAVLMLGIALADFALSPNAPVSHLYYLPILLAAINLGRRAGVGVALLSVVLAHLADPELARLHYTEADVMELLLFITVALVAARLSADARALRRLASTDDLTGLHNLRSFEALARELIDGAARDGGPVSMLCLDVDRLKRLNDTWGHLTGADAVKRVGSLLASVLPPEAVACRYGGDEFAIVWRADLPSARALGRHLQAQVSADAPVLDERPFAVGTLSVSVGVASAQPPRDVQAAPCFTRLFRDADVAMYANKQQRSPAPIVS